MVIKLVLLAQGQEEPIAAEACAGADSELQPNSASAQTIKAQRPKRQQGVISRAKQRSTFPTAVVCLADEGPNAYPN